MSADNREHWPTLSRRDVADRLVQFGVPEERSNRMGPRAAVREMRRLEERNEIFTNCLVEVLIEDMITHGVALVEVEGPTEGEVDYKLSVPTVQAEKWVAAIRPTLRFRKDEIVAAWQARTEKPDCRVCPRCLAMIYDPEYEGVGCSSIFSCPFRR